MSKRERIQEEIEHNGLILLEYGIPLDTIAYQKIWERIDLEGYSIEISTLAANVVEKEKTDGRPGAFVIRRQVDQFGTDNVEVYGWER